MFKNLNPAALGISSRDSALIELILSHGFKGLDLDLVEFAEQVQAQGFPRASRLIVSARLKIGSVQLPVRCNAEADDYKQDLDRLPALADIAAQMGCTRATTLIAPGSDTKPYHENFELYRRRLAEVAAVLKPHKIRLGVGFLAPVLCRADFPFQFIQTFDELALLLRNVDSDNVGLAFDSWHWHLGGGKLESLRAFNAGRIVTVSLADADPSLTAANAALTGRRLPGEGGAIDLPPVLTTLGELGYDGPVTLLPDPSQFAGLGRDTIVKNCAAALDTIWKAAGLNPAGRLAAVKER